MPQLHEFLVIIAAALIAAPLFRRFGLGAILGYLVAGIALGPFGLNLIDDAHRMLNLSELGVIMLLFVIGLELQPSRLWTLRRQIFGLGSAQVGLTSLALAGLLHWAGLPWLLAGIAGFGLSLSSTAFVLQTLAEKKQLSTRYGRDSFAILLFQDLAIIPALSLLPLLASTSASLDWLKILEGFCILCLIVIAARFVLGPLLRILVRSGLREIFTAGALFVVLGMAATVEHIGLSMSLGAFIAGVLLADSQYRHELEATIEPFKGLLLGLFFIAIGMTANLQAIWTNPGLVLGGALGLILTKALCLLSISKLVGSSWLQSLRLALALAQGGEFAFVLFTQASRHSLVSTATADLLVMVVTLSLLLSPLVFTLGSRLLDRLQASKAPQPFDRIDEPGNAVVIAGFGRVGQIIARVLAMRNIPFTAIENNPDQVDFVRKFGSKVFYGNPSQLELLDAAKVGDAKVFVLAEDNIELSLRTAELMRHHFPQIPIYARARNRFHCYRLMDLGVKMITRDTLLSSLAMSRDVLEGLGVPAEDARNSVELFHQHDEKLLKKQQAIYKDEQALIQNARQAREELRQLFENDAEKSTAVQK